MFYNVWEETLLGRIESFAKEHVQKYEVEFGHFWDIPICVTFLSIKFFHVWCQVSFSQNLSKIKFSFQSCNWFKITQHTIVTVGQLLKNKKMIKL